MRSARHGISEFAAARSLNVHDNLTRILLTAQEQAAILGQFSPEEITLRIRLYSASIFEHGCKNLGFVDLDGNLTTANGNSVSWTAQTFLSQISSGRPSITDGEKDPIDNSIVNVAAAPVFHEGRIVGAFVILFTNQQLNQAFRASMVNSKGPSLLVSARGDVISISVSGTLDTANVFTAVRQERILLGTTVDELRELMRRGKSGITSCTFKDVDYLMAYAPVQMNGWYTFSLQPFSYLEEEVSFHNELFARLMLVLALGTGGLLLYIVFLVIAGMWNENNKSRRIQTLVSNIPGGVIRVQNDGNYFKFINGSSGFYAMTGYTRQQFAQKFGDNYLSFVYPEDREQILHKVLKEISDELHSEIEYRVHTQDGSVRWFLGRGQAIPGSSAIDCVVLDITERKEFETHLAMDAERNRLLFELSGNIFYEYDLENHTLHMGTGFKDKFGFMPDTYWLPSSFMETRSIHRDDKDKMEELCAQARATQSSAETMLRIRKASGRHVWCRIRQVHIFNSKNRLTKAIGMIVDIDEQIRAMERLNREKQRDPFTRLLNKISTREMVDSYIAQTSPGECGALCIINLDNFKTVNEDHGHDTGDALLFQAAKHLRQTFRSSDIIGRIGGDEFLVFFKALPNIDVLLSKLDFLRSLFRDGCYVNGVDVQCTVSAGIAVYPVHGATFAKLYRNADRALRHSKLLRDAFTVYDPDQFAEKNVQAPEPDKQR